MKADNWNAGQVVKVGFMAGLVVVKKIPTPGDFLPDAYLLEKSGRYYRFTPYNGIESCDANGN